MSKKTGIYKIENSTNGKVYIGSAVSIYSRWKAHRSYLNRGVHTNSKLQNAWNKYGSEVFIFAIVEECDKADLISTEQRYLDEYDASRTGYNIRAIANSNLGVKQSPDTISKRIQHQIGEKNHNYGKKFSEDTLLKMSQAKLGKKHSPESIEKMRLKPGETHFNKGKKRSEESKLKMSLAKLGKKQSPEFIKKRFEAIARNRESRKLKETPDFAV